MRISPEKLAAEAEATGFRPDVLEQVAQLLRLLDTFRSHPFLEGELVLKAMTQRITGNSRYSWPRLNHSLEAQSIVLIRDYRFSSETSFERTILEGAIGSSPRAGCGPVCGTWPAG